MEIWWPPCYVGYFTCNKVGQLICCWDLHPKWQILNWNSTTFITLLHNFSGEKMEFCSSCFSVLKSFCNTTINALQSGVVLYKNMELKIQNLNLQNRNVRLYMNELVRFENRKEGGEVRIDVLLTYSCGSTPFWQHSMGKIRLKYGFIIVERLLLKYSVGPLL